MWGPGEESMWFEFQYFAARGFALVFANPRGSGGYGEAFQRANHQDWGRGPAADVLAWGPDGVFLSNGPGDPAAVTYAIENVKAIVASGILIQGMNGTRFEIVTLSATWGLRRMCFAFHESFPARTYRIRSIAT